MPSIRRVSVTVPTLLLQDLPSAAAAALAMLRDSDLAVLPAAVSAAARQAADLAEQLEVRFITRCLGGQGCPGM